MIKEPFWIEALMIENNYYEFASEPSLYVFLCLTGDTSESLLCIITHLKLDLDLLSFRRIVVAPDNEILAGYALELLSPHFYEYLRVLIQRIDRGYIVRI